MIPRQKSLAGALQVMDQTSLAKAVPEKLSKLEKPTETDWEM